MTTFTMPTTTTFRLPTRQEIAKMMTRPGVLVTALICATLVVLAFVTAVTLLAYSGKSSEALTLAVVGPVIGILVSMSNRLRNVERNTTSNTPDGGQ